jgi:hypothetical protein|uniref:Uncharacterized protein n=1 Tax=Siphoviridae sp. ctQCU10 TaxID=2823579 RepID=A0A8S5LAV1_9CAUD|nr:MAG TPA: hypothetical protein [Siphoviridae sp. ctQCU10]DAX50305.1 MAG TPA: hypothetical protein [Caudoviricetes sp.]
MDFQEYEKDGVTITATETAYEVIYKAQGFRPKEEKPPEPVQNNDKNDTGKGGTKGGSRGGKAGSDPGDHGEGAPAGEAQDA